MLRSIPLKPYTTKQMMQNEAGEIIAYQPTGADLIRAILLARKPIGFAISDLRQIMQIMDALDAATGKDALLLDEGLWRTLNKMVAEHVWPVYDPCFIAFADDVANASKVDPNASKEVAA